MKAEAGGYGMLLDLGASNFSVATDGPNVIASQPAISFGPMGSSVAQFLPRLSRSSLFNVFTYETTLAGGSGYNWLSGPEPQCQATNNTCIWFEEPTNPPGTLLYYTPPTTATGLNHSAQDSETLRTFLSGALVGIAGGAFVGAIQEALHERQETKQRTRGETKLAAEG
jgi:hypothetical protein